MIENHNDINSHLKFYNRPNSAAKHYYITSVFWVVIATLYGLTAATELVAPDIFGSIAHITFGRIRPIHINLVLFGFLTPSLIGSALYIIPVLTKTKLYSELFANISVLVWNIFLIASVGTLTLGKTQGREYAELIWPIDIMVILCFLILSYVVIRTLMNRTENLMFVSLWYIMGAFIWTSVLYTLGNVVWNPDTGALKGMTDAIWLWFYGHNIFGLLLTPLAVAAAYYIIPRISGTPVYSHTMSLIGFWMLLVMYTHIGTHHLIQAPAPQWLKVISIVDSIGMLIPVMTFLTNIWLTAKGRLYTVLSDVSGKFIFAGTVFYFLVCIQGPLQSLPSVQRVTHFNNWVVAHAHLALLGFAGFTAIGAMYYFLPKVTKRKIYSLSLADFQYWLLMIGVNGFFLVLTGVGLVQGSSWLHGETVYRVLPAMGVYFVIRLFLGVFVVAGFLIGLYNVLMTLLSKKTVLTEKEVAAL
jgi:cytochrome c oxidase cbb3-type subunit I